MKKTLMIAAAAAFMMSGFVATEAIAGPEGKCKACHNFSAKGKVGPGLAAVVGREAGPRGQASLDKPFKKYSKALKGATWTWNEENLRAWICNSKKAVKVLTGDDHARTKMPPQKMCGAKGDAIIAFLKTI